MNARPSGHLLNQEVAIRGECHQITPFASPSLQCVEIKFDEEVVIQTSQVPDLLEALVVEKTDLQPLPISTRADPHTS